MYTVNNVRAIWGRGGGQGRLYYIEEQAVCSYSVSSVLAGLGNKDPLPQYHQEVFPDVFNGLGLSPSHYSPFIAESCF